jgi:hypothetical protein
MSEAKTPPAKSTKAPFAATSTKLTIFSHDEPDNKSLEVKAQYNPKELQVDRTIPWAKPQATNKTGNAGDAGAIRLEFTGAEGRSMSVELLFDGYETGGGDVATRIAALEKLASVRTADGSKSVERRPHHCCVLWGQNGLPKFNCVIESLSIKYQMFSDDGKPLRATATVKLKEADAVQLAKKT